MSGRQRSEGDDTARGDPSRRVRREDPQQSGPDRSWQGWLQNTPWGFFANQRKQDPQGTDEPRGGRPANPMETVERGVKMAYQVVEDYIEQGRQVAQKLNTQQYGPREMGNDLQAVTERMMRDSTRFLSLWFELMGSAMGMAWGRAPTSKDPSAPAAKKTSTESPRPRPLERAPVAVDVASRLAVQVEVELLPGAYDQSLHVTPLQAVSGDAAPITGVTFEPGTPGRPAVVRLRVPSDQAPGRYYGTLADPDSHKSLGRVTVILSEPTDGAKTPAVQKTSAKKGPAKKGPAKSPSKKSPAKKTSRKKASAKKTTGRKGSS